MGRRGRCERGGEEEGGGGEGTEGMESWDLGVEEKYCEGGEGKEEEYVVMGWDSRAGQEHWLG